MNAHRAALPAAAAGAATFHAAGGAASAAGTAIAAKREGQLIGFDVDGHFVVGNCFAVDFEAGRVSIDDRPALTRGDLHHVSVEGNTLTVRTDPVNANAIQRRAFATEANAMTAFNVLSKFMDGEVLRPAENEPRVIGYHERQRAAVKVFSKSIMTFAILFAAMVIIGFQSEGAIVFGLFVIAAGWASAKGSPALTARANPLGVPDSRN